MMRRPHFVVGSLVVASLSIALSAASSPANDAYVAKARHDIAAATSKDGKATTAEETKATQDFWRDTAPVLAARDAAAAKKDTAAVARADAALARMNQALIHHLTELNAKAPRPAAATPSASASTAHGPSAVGAVWDSVYSNSNPDPDGDGLICPAGSSENPGAYTVSQGRLKFDVVWVDHQYQPTTTNGRRVIHVDVPIKPQGRKGIVDERMAIQSLNLDNEKPQRTYTQAHVTATFDRDDTDNGELGTGREANIVFHVGPDVWNDSEGSGEGCGEQHAFARNFTAAPPPARERPNPATCHAVGGSCTYGAQCCSNMCRFNACAAR